jgi:hypothetical protein
MGFKEGFEAAERLFGKWLGSSVDSKVRRGQRHAVRSLGLLREADGDAREKVRGDQGRERGSGRV